jgi:hypothetical protein
LETIAITSQDLDEIQKITTQLASIARSETAQASLSTHLLKTDQEKRHPSRNDRRVISKAKVIGRKELERLRKKKIIDTEKSEEKNRKRLESQLEGPTGKRRKAILRELQSLQNSGQDVMLESHGMSEGGVASTLVEARLPTALQQLSGNERGEPGPSTKSVRR